jgi:hypothetical protein
MLNKRGRGEIEKERERENGRRGGRVRKKILRIRKEEN